MSSQGDQIENPRPLGNNNGHDVTETCAMCLGSGSVAVGPWGVRPPKKTCPECSGRKRVPIGHRYNDPTVQPERTTS